MSNEETYNKNNDQMNGVHSTTFYQLIKSMIIDRPFGHKSYPRIDPEQY